jgi:hypothetical protein
LRNAAPARNIGCEGSKGFGMFIRLSILAAAAALPAAAAAQVEQGQARPEAFEALIRCRTIAEDGARLRCFDEATAALQAAAERRDVVVVDRAQVRESRRRLFGIALPRLPVFGGSDDDEVDEVQGVVASASQDGLGHWMITLQDGAVWIQTDNRRLALRPRPGQPVVVSRAALGSFMMRVNRQPGIRVRRSL